MSVPVAAYTRPAAAARPISAERGNRRESSVATAPAPTRPTSETKRARAPMRTPAASTVQGEGREADARGTRGDADPLEGLEPLAEPPDGEHGERRDADDGRRHHERDRRHPQRHELEPPGNEDEGGGPPRASRRRSRRPGPPSRASRRPRGAPQLAATEEPEPEAEADRGPESEDEAGRERSFRARHRTDLRLPSLRPAARARQRASSHRYVVRQPFGSTTRIPSTSTSSSAWGRDG